jgi:hypothetical protein
MNAGRLTKLPPPVSEFIVPATKPAPASIRSVSTRQSWRGDGGEAIPFCGGVASRRAKG